MNHGEFVLENKSLKTSIQLLYFLLFFGAIWNVTGLFSNLMGFLTAPMMISIGLLTLFSVPKSNLKAALVWFLATAILTIFVEWLGIKTGLIFGTYFYTEFLQPQIASVPVAIGVAWAGSCLGAIGFVQLFPKLNSLSTSVKALLTGFLMLLFDVFLEPVAIKLGYWSWSDLFPPLQNYVAWWIIGSLFAFGILKVLKENKLSSIAFHTFIAQLMYFGIIILF